MNDDFPRLPQSSDLSVNDPRMEGLMSDLCCEFDQHDSTMACWDSLSRSLDEHGLRIAVAPSKEALTGKLKLLDDRTISYAGTPIAIEFLESLVAPENIPSQWMRVVRKEGENGVVTIESAELGHVPGSGWRL